MDGGGWKVLFSSLLCFHSECAAHSSERKIQTLQKKYQSEGKKRKKRRSSIFFSLVFIFLQTVAKPPTWASMASLHRPTSGLHCRSKRKKERRRILFIRFLLGGVLRSSTKSQNDKWWSRREKNKNKNKKDTNKQKNYTVEKRKSTGTVHNSCWCVPKKKRAKKDTHPFISRHCWWHLIFLFFRLKLDFAEKIK